MKLDEKTNDLKLKSTWQLGELKTIISLDHNAASSQPSFLIEFETRNADEQGKYVWKCEGLDERKEFLTTLWKLADQFIQSSERPEFRNFQYQSKSTSESSSDLIESKSDKNSNTFIKTRR